MTERDGGVQAGVCVCVRAKEGRKEGTNDRIQQRQKPKKVSQRRRNVGKIQLLNLNAGIRFRAMYHQFTCFSSLNKLSFSCIQVMACTYVIAQQIQLDTISPRKMGSMR